MKTKDFFSTGEAAGITGLSQGTIINYCDQGKIEASQARITNYRKIPRESLFKFMKDNEIPFDNLNDRIRILVIDDEPNVVKTVKRVLKKTSRYVIESAFDGYDGCIKAGSFKPDVIILDLKMPGVDGFEVCKKIKENAETSHAEIVVLTGYKTGKNMLRLEKLGIKYVLSKPFESDGLLGMLEDIVIFEEAGS